MMKKFSQNQAIHSLDLPLDKDFSMLLPEGYRQELKSDMHTDSLHLLHYVRSPVNRIDTFAFKSTTEITLLPPFFADVLNFEVAEQLQSVYKQLYPRHDLKPVSRFCHKFGRITIAGDLIGSDMPGQNSRSSSVIMAFWPSKGNTLNNIDYSQMQVGVVQFFMHHMLSYSNGGDLIKEEHIFAYVLWKQMHPHFNWYGVSATVCVDMFESVGSCCLLPVQRIGHRCAYTIMPVNFGDITETVFFACPIPLSYCL